MNEETTKAERLVREFRRRILSGEFPPDRWLRQDELASEFGVSITPVREALRLLASERLVVAEAHRGVRVVGLDPENIVADYVLRRLTESFAVRRAVHRMSRHDISNLEQLLEREPAPVDAPAHNREFHFYFYDRCGLPGLPEKIAQLWEGFPWDVLLGTDSRLHASEQEHRAILDAAANGDAALAAAAMEAHLASGLQAILVHLGGTEAGVDPFEEL